VEEKGECFPLLVEFSCLNCLLEMNQLRCRAKLAHGQFGRGLFAVTDIEPGCVVLDVPLDICIIRQLDASEANIKVDDQMTTTQRKQLCWILEFFLTAELLQAVSEGGDEFWLKYKPLLPPHDTPFPLLMEKVFADRCSSADDLRDQFDRRGLRSLLSAMPP
jgi:hypothetical protein